MRYLDLSGLKNRIEKRISEDISSGRVGGAEVLVKQEGMTAYEGCFGNAFGGAIYRIASMTKPVTAVAALILMEEGKLGLDDTVEKYLPFFKDLPLVKLEGDRIVKCGTARVKPTVFHILTHTSGVGGGAIGSIQQRSMSAEEKASLTKAVKYYAVMGIQFEPFTEVLYSGTAAFDLLTAIIEKITDMPYGDFLRERIFEPLGMTDTAFEPSPEQWARMIEMHDYIDGKGTAGNTYGGCVFEDFPVSHPLGGAGLISTLSDYSSFAEMLLNGGKGIITPDSIKLMSTPHVPYAIQPRNKRWGLAVKAVTDESYGSLPLGAYGWSGAYGTHFWVDPENRITAVYMKNSQYDGGGSSVTGENFEWDVTLSLKV